MSTDGSPGELAGGRRALQAERALLSSSAIRALAEERWNRKRPWLDWPLIIAFVLAMTALFAPIVAGHVAVLPVDSIAAQTIRAERSVSAIDEEATQLKREQAAAAVRPQFDHEPEALIARRGQVSAAFETLVERRGQRDLATDQRRAKFETELGSPVNAAVFERIEALDDPTEAGAALAFFLDPLLNRMIVADRALLPQLGAIELRRADQPNPLPLFDLGTVLDQEEAWRLMRARSADAPYGAARGLRTWITETALALAKPNLKPNEVATSGLRSAAAAAVEPVMMRIGRGEVIVREGDRVSREDHARLRALDEASSARLSWVDSVAFAALFAGLIGLGGFFYARAREPLRFSRKTAYLTLSSTLVAAVSALAVWFAGRALADVFALDPTMAALLSPVALGTVLVALLVNVRTSLLVGITLALLLTYRADGGVWVAGYHLIGVLVAGIMAQRARQRVDLLKLGLAVGLSQAIASPAVLTLGGAVPNVDYLVAVAFGLVSGGLVAVAAIGLLPLFEHLFDETTDFRLIELASLGHPTLKKLALHSPGTYHHSVMIANLAEAAAEAIGANGLKCRVMALYHDIGKAERPAYFIENQRERNIHDSLAPDVSARIIFAHITDGIALARKHRLGRPVIDAITQHQGTTLLKAFHQKALERAGRSETIDESEFRYPGPKPRTRESAIIMLGDSVEAATRALKSPSPAEVRVRVAKVIAEKLADGQLSDCALTLGDLSRVEEAFARVLVLGVYHGRIEYPPVRAPLGAGIEAREDRDEDQQHHDRGKNSGWGVAERAS